MKQIIAARQTLFVMAVAAVFSGLLAGCYSMRSSSGGGETNFSPPRQVDPADVAVPDGFRVTVVATGLTFPTGIAFAPDGQAYVTESGYSYGEVFTEPRLVRLVDGRKETVLDGGRSGPWTGVQHHDGHLFVADGGVLEGGRILRISPEGEFTVLVEDLPSLGDHHTNGPAIGPDGMLYFGQGTATNSGVVGTDNWKFGWLKRFPEFHDRPGANVKLREVTFETKDLLEEGRGQVRTAAFSPFGHVAAAGDRVPAAVVASGSINRISPSGGAVEQVAWGFRNPFGLAFSPGGELYVTENGFDNRGSRPVWGGADHLWRVEPGQWYGWPDYSGGRPLTDQQFQPPGGPPLEFLLAEHPQRPPAPVARFAGHSSSNGLDFSTSDDFGYRGEAFVAQWGDMAPDTNKLMGPAGFKVVRVSPETGEVTDFAVNRGKINGPASLVGGGGLERPVAARFGPGGEALYVVDFGVLTMSPQGPRPQKETGVIWKISRAGAGR